MAIIIALMVVFCTYTPTLFLASDDCMLVQHCLQIPSPLPIFLFLQYRHLIPAPVNRTSASVCLIKHPWIACKQYAKHSNGPHSLRIKATFSREAQEYGWQPGLRSCIMPGLPMHLVQELNVSTVLVNYGIYIVFCSSLFIRFCYCIFTYVDVVNKQFNTMLFARTNKCF